MHAGSTRPSQPRVIAAPAEVPHVGVQRLGAGDGEDDGGEREEGDAEVPGEEADGVGRGERLEDLGVRRRCRATPQAPIATNQTIMTGPNSRPTAAVPRRWTANSSTMITAVIGTTSSSSAGSTTFRPSTAESTEIAGVIMLSPKNSAAPKMPSAASTADARRLRACRRTGAAA